MSTNLHAAVEDALGGKPTAPPAPSPLAMPPSAKPHMAEVRVRDIIPDADNPRDDLVDITELAASIASAGLIQPIIVRRHEGRLRIVAGHRRLAALQELGWETTQVVIRPDIRPDDVLAAMLIENGQRRDLDPIEEARALRRLKTQMGDVSDADLGRRLGIPSRRVNERLMLLSLPIEQQEEIRAGAMSMTEATTLARLTSGRIRPKSVGRPAVGHLSATHGLAGKAKARCQRLGHSRGKGVGVGGIACGECWESVIRADEREQLHAHSAKTGTCALCDAPTTASVS